MRVRILFYLFLMAVGVCNAQDYSYSPFVEDGKTWHMKYVNEESPEYPAYDYCYYIQGDTVIGGIECKKFYVFNENNDNATRYLMAVYEADKKVYFIPNKTGSSFVLYDFTIPCGYSEPVTDVIHTDWIINMENIEEKVISIKGDSRRCVRLRQTGLSPLPEYEATSGWWIEGVGSELGPLNTWLFGASGNNTYLQGCSIKEKELFSTADLKDLKTQVQLVRSDDTNSETDIYSVSGIKLKHGVGVYIQNGKKY